MPFVHLIGRNVVKIELLRQKFEQGRENEGEKGAHERHH
jgi:hypothetical protein